MKPLNHSKIKVHRLKFLGMYIISVILIIVVLSGFFQPALITKNVMVEKEKPAKVVIKKIYITKPNSTDNYFKERDSLKAAINLSQQKLIELNTYIHSQRDTIKQLQQQSAKTNQPIINNSNKNEVAELKKQIKFFDWALRSQVAVTNTLTQENNNLKNKIAQLNKHK